MRIGWLFLSALFLATGFPVAQEFRAKLTGHVTDPSGASVPNAIVQARNLATNEVATANADAEGSYTIPFLKPGNYNLSAEASGFKKVIKENLVLNVGQTAAIDLSLELGAVSDTVTVNAEIALMETTRADRGLVIDTQRVSEFPLNARNPFMLANLSAGVNYNTGLIYQRPFDNGGIADWTVNGGYNRNNEFLLDGAPNNGQAGGNNIALVPSVDAVQEFKIQTNSFDAQYGKTAGGILNVTMKSGGNALHGTAYEFARRAQWDANSFQNNAAGLDRFGCASSQSATDVKCRDTASGHFLDQYGFTVGGPVYIPKLYDGRNKSFFFYAYEGYREGTPTPLRLSYPAPEFLNGDFSNLKDNNGNKITIYDPATGRNVNGTWTRDPFPNNLIPTNRINPIASKLLSLYPKPNIPSAGSFYSQSNYAEQSIDRDDFYNMMVRYDQNIGDKHRFFFREANNKRTEIRPYQTIGGVGADGQNPLERINHAFVLDWVGTLKATMVSNLRVSWARYVDGARGDSNQGHSPAELGFPSSMVSQLSVPDWFGRYEIDNYAAIGRYYTYNYTTTFAMNPNITWLYRGHSIHVGLDYRTIVYNVQNVGNPLRIQATKAATQKVYNTADSLSGNAIASLLLGTVGGGGADYNVMPSFVQRYYAPFIQDDWKLTRKLTVNLGLRWDFNLAPFERYDRLNRGFDPNVVSPVDKLFDHSKYPELPISTIKGGQLFAGTGGAPRRAGNIDWTDIQPRLGFAYQLNPRMVLRGGWGRYYMNPQNDYQQTNGYSYNTPIVTSLDGGRTPIPGLLNNPFPSGITVPTGSSLGLSTFLGRSPNFFDPTFKVPIVNQFSFGIQLQLPMHSNLEVSYVGNRSDKLQNSIGYNEYDLAFRKKCNPMEGGTPSYCDALVANPFYNLAAFSGTSLGTSATVSRTTLNRPFPQFSTFSQLGRNDGKYWYNSLQTTYQMRSYAGVNLTFAYTFSKGIEMGALNVSNAGAGSVSYVDVQQRILQKSVYSFDRPHTLKIGTVWELPFGRGRKLFNTSHGLWSRLASGWQHTLMFQYSSGKPWEFPGNVVYLKDASISVDWSAPKVYGVRPCVLKMAANGTTTPQPYSSAYGCGTDQSTYNFLFVPSSLYAPRMSPMHFPNLRLHAVPQMDMSINKTTRINEQMSVQFRAEFFNLTNTFFMSRQNFQADLDNSNFGTITKATVASDQANFPRQIQFAVKFIF